MTVIADNALSREDGAQGRFECEGRIRRKRGEGRGCFHRFGEISHELAGQLRIGKQIGDVIPTRTQTDDGIEGDGH